MDDEPFLAIAIQKARTGAETEYVGIMTEMITFVATNGYGRDRFFKDDETGCFIDIREWRSREQARLAHSDPRLRVCWRRLAEVAETVAIYGDLVELG